jgi:hypothetical protein
LYISDLMAPEGKTVFVTAVLNNLEKSDQTVTAELYLNDEVHTSKSVRIAKMNSEKVQFQIQPEAGEYTVKIGKLDYSTFNPNALATSSSTTTCSPLRFTTPKLPSNVHMHQPMPNFSQDSLTSCSQAALYFGGQ